MSSRIRHLERDRVDPIERVEEKIAFARAGVRGRLHPDLRSLQFHGIEGHGSSQGIASQTFQRGRVIAPHHPLAVHREPGVHPAEQALLELLGQALGSNQPLQHQAPKQLFHDLRRPAREIQELVARAVLEGRPDLPCSLRDGVPLSLERTILKALAREPAGRQRDAEEFLAELRQAGDDLNALELTHQPLVRRRRRHFGTLLPTLAAILFLGIILLIARLFQLHGR